MDSQATGTRRLLLLTAPYGDGHTRAAEAIEEGIACVAPGWECVLVDYFHEFVPGIVTTLSRKAYLDSIRLAPASYGVFYRAIGKVKPDSRIRKMMDSPGRRGLSRYLAAHPFDVIVSLYPIPSGAVAYLKQRGTVPAQLVTVVTDYTCHPEWIHGGTDAYVVGSDSVADLMVGYGVERARICALGIPVRAAFARAARETRPESVRKRRVLVMAGAYGALGGIGDLADALGKLSAQVEVTFVCGRAEALADKLELLTQSWPGRPRILGYVHDVAREMAAADLIVSKAGGITVSEALALGRPLLIYKPIPGQEQRNCDFLQEHGAGVAIRTPGDLNRVLRDLLAHPGELARMSRAARVIAKPDAARDIAMLVVRMAATAASA